MFKFLEIILRYLETIVNIFSNALIQTYLVYTTVVLIYKFYIADQTTNYIPTFISQILNKLRQTFMELEFIRNNFSAVNRITLETKYETASKEEIDINTDNKAYNNKIINKAPIVSIGIFSLFVLFVLVTSRLSVQIHWYQLLLSAVITIVGTSYEYFFITQIIIKYNYIELTNIYDNVTNNIEKIAGDIIDNKLIDNLRTIVEKNDNIINDGNKLLNIVNKQPVNKIINEIGNEIQEQTSNNSKTISNIISNIKLISNKYDNALNKIGNSMNDIDHNILKERFNY